MGQKEFCNNFAEKRLTLWVVFSSGTKINHAENFFFLIHVSKEIFCGYSISPNYVVIKYLNEMET